MIKVFVYGTLRKGERNHDFFLAKNNAKFIGVTQTPPGFLMFCPRSVPYVIKVEGFVGQVYGEVYEVDKQTLRRLDDLEGHPHAYKREEITTVNGHEAWIYLSAREGIVSSGNFKRVRNR